MTPSRYDTLPIPETFEPIIACVQRLMNYDWMADSSRKEHLRHQIIVWAVHTSGQMTLQAIADHLGLTRQGIQHKVTRIQSLLEAMHPTADLMAAMDYPLEPEREHDVIVDDRIHATDMIVSREDHDAIEHVERGDWLSFFLKERDMQQGRRYAWDGVENNRPMFGHANEARLQKQWYDRVQKAYWYDPSSKTVHEHV